MAEIHVKKMSMSKGGSIKAFLTVVVNGVEINGVRVAEGRNGFFVAMPSRKDDQGKFWNITYIEDIELHAEFSNVVMEAYRKGSVAAIVGDANEESLPF